MKTFIDITLIMNGAFGFICSFIVLYVLMDGFIFFQFYNLAI